MPRTLFFAPLQLAGFRMSAVLTMIEGPRPGARYTLSPEGETTLGRGAECTIIVADTLCSRVHAVVSRDATGWNLRDADSRNGTFLDEQPIGAAPLRDGQTIRIGSTEFTFRDSSEAASGEAADFGLTVVRDAPLTMAGLEPPEPAPTQPAPTALQHGWVFSLAQRLLAAVTAGEVLMAAIEQVRKSCGATMAGFATLDDGRLRPHTFEPDPPADWRLSDAVTRLVCEEQHAVWLAHEQGDATSGGDALCIPVVDGERALGALYVQLDRGRFRQSDFDLVIGVANLVGAALGRLHRDDAPDAIGPSDTLDITTWERRLIVEALRRTAGSVPEAARLLGFSRATLYRKIEEYGIPRN